MPRHTASCPALFPTCQGSPLCGGTVLKRIEQLKAFFPARTARGAQRQVHLLTGLKESCGGAPHRHSSRSFHWSNCATGRRKRYSKQRPSLCCRTMRRRGCCATLTGELRPITLTCTRKRAPLSHLRCAVTSLKTDMRARAGTFTLQQCNAIPFCLFSSGLRHAPLFQLWTSPGTISTAGRCVSASLGPDLAARCTCANAKDLKAAFPSRWLLLPVCRDAQTASQSYFGDMNGVRGKLGLVRDPDALPEPPAPSVSPTEAGPGRRTRGGARARVVQQQV